MSEKYVFQSDMFDCGEAALKTIFLQYGKRLQVNITGKNQGLTAYELIKFSKKNGIMAKGVKTNLSYITEENLPCIAHIIKDKSYFHYIVILKNNESGKNVTVFDPAEGVKFISYSEFNKISTGVFILFQKTKIKKERDNRLKQILIKLVKNNKKIIFKSIFFSTIAILLSILFSFYLKFLLLYQNHIIIISVLFLFVSLFKNIFSYIKNKLIIKLNEKIDADINDTLVTHIFKLPHSYFQQRATGYLMTIISDIENFKNLIVKIFIVFFVDLLFILFIAGFISILNLYYLVILILFIILKLTLSYIYSEKYNDNYVKLKASKIRSSSYFVNVFENINSVKNLFIENKTSQKIKENELRLLCEKEDFNKNNNKYLSANLFLEDLFLIFLMFMSVLTNDNGFSLVNLITFINIYQIFLSFLNNVCEVIVMYKTYLSSIGNVLDILEEKEEVFEKSGTNFEINKVEYKNVSYRFDDKVLFSSVSFVIKENDSIFIEGKSGVGKTTLVKLLLKCFDNYKGEIKINDVGISNLKNNFIRSKITYVSGNEKLFTDTIYNNLSIVNSNKEKIDKVLKICQINDFLKNKKVDSNYVIDNLSNNLSGGEKNKILIARALLKEAKIIIFDECFNEIDIKTERKILKDIMNNYDITIVFISHRKNNIDLFNKYYKLKNKKLVKFREEEYAEINK